MCVHTAQTEWVEAWKEETDNRIRNMKYLKKDKKYDQTFKALMEKNWDYGQLPDGNKKGRLGVFTVRHKLDSKLMRAVLKAYFDANKMDKYKWILNELDRFKFYLFDTINHDGTINYDGIDLSRYQVFTGFNLCDQLLKAHNIDPDKAKQEDKNMVFAWNIDKPYRYNYNCQLVVEIDGNTMGKYFINTIGRHSMENAFQSKVC